MPITPIAHNCPSSMATSILLITVHLPPPSPPPPRLIIKISTVEMDRTYLWLSYSYETEKGKVCHNEGGEPDLTEQYIKLPFSILKF